jgi:hypothetical protein
MKIASSSASFDGRLRAGELTQLEWLDICAREFELDGVVFDLRHFPRTDDDYLAQLKKLCVDLGLSAAAVTDDELLAGAGTPRAIAIAASLGAPLVVARAPHASEEATAWNALAKTARAAAVAGKTANVTVAVRNAPATLCEDVAALKQLAKDTDSAWLRYALDPAKLPPNEPSESALTRSVIVFHDVLALRTHSERDETAELAAALRRFRGFLVVDSVAEGAAPDDVERTIRSLRAIFAKTALQEAPVA